MASRLVKEFCAENVERVPEAIAAGAGRIELCDNLAVGGTTPSHGVIRAAVELARPAGIPVMCMIRPRGGSFEYSGAEARIMVDDLGYSGDGITHISARFGYMDAPDVRAALRLVKPEDTEGEINVEGASYFLSKIELTRGPAPTMATWRKRLFIATSYITADAAEYFGLSRDRTVIMGSRIEV